jgi:uncharacterized protein YaaN involved in tellurite resistance
MTKDAEPTGTESIDLPVPTQQVIERPALEPEPPKSMTADDVAAVKRQATEIAARLATADGSEELQVVDSISNLGVQAQRGAASELDLLRARLGEMMTKDSPGGAIAGDLAELRMALAKISPQLAGEGGIVARVLRVKGAGPVRGVLERIAIRYEPVSKQIAVIETRLRDGRTLLARDNIELRKLYESVEAQHLTIEKNAYLGEQLICELQALLSRTDDPLKRDRVMNAVHDLSLRVQDLRTMAEVDLQFYVSIDLSRLNNTRLGQAVERTLTLSTNVVMVGLAIQVALSRQRRVMEANQRTREFLGNVVATNAALIKRHTSEISDAFNNPVIALEKLSQAHNDLLEALDIADRTRQDGIARARETIAKLVQMSAGLDARANALAAPAVPTLEA